MHTLCTLPALPPCWVAYESASAYKPRPATPSGAGPRARCSVVGGFSQGGHIAYKTVLTHPQPLAGCAALSTWLEPSIREASRAHRSRRHLAFCPGTGLDCAPAPVAHCWPASRTAARLFFPACAPCVPVLSHACARHHAPAAGRLRLGCHDPCEGPGLLRRLSLPVSAHGWPRQRRCRLPTWACPCSAATAAWTTSFPR